MTSAISQSKLLADVRRYVAMGDHWTGGPADAATSRWIAERLARSGLAVTEHSRSVRQFVLEECRARLGSARLECAPLWFPRALEPTEGVVVPVASPDLRGAIALAAIDHEPSGTVVPGSPIDDAVRDAARRGARAAIVVTRNPRGELLVPNVTEDRAETPLPVVLVAGRAEGRLVDAARDGTAARVLVRGNARELAAVSVVGAVRAGRGPGIVLSVATSGWFTCAGERGSGVAIFLALARSLAARRRGVPFWLVATTGHELGSLGLRALLEAGALPPPERVAAWLHIGPGLATRYWRARGPRPRPQVLLLATPDDAEVLASTLRVPGVQVPITSWAVGDVELLRRRGYRASTLLSTYPLHHTRRDRAEQIAPELLAPTARAFDDALAALARRSGARRAKA